MLYATTTATKRRAALRRALAGDGCLQFPGAFSPLSTRLIAERGFDGVYLSGAVMSAELGLPDIGLTTLDEVARRATEVARATDLPVLVDADTGFGEPMNVARTVQALEDAGVAAIHIEDQENPKRCGHLDGKSVVDAATATKRIRAAVGARRDPSLVVMARTDMRAVAGFDATVERARQLVEAGADAIFPEALESLDEFAAMRDAVGVPILANMTEFGRSELFSHEALAGAGVSVVIYPVSLLRIAMGAIERALDVLATSGSLEPVVPSMLTRARLYELVDYAGYAAFDEGVFNFAVPDHPAAHERATRKTKEATSDG